MQALWRTVGCDWEKNQLRGDGQIEYHLREDYRGTSRRSAATHSLKKVWMQGVSDKAYLN
jgi:hypothetical protein